MNSTSCLQSGNECIYPVTGEEVPLDGSSDDGSTKDLVRLSPAMAGAPGLKTPLSDFVGGSYEILPKSSKRLLRHCKSWDSYAGGGLLLRRRRVVQSRNMLYGARDP